ncbi:hypothetical protein D3C80_1552160 [compost metagenome]
MTYLTGHAIMTIDQLSVRYNTTADTGTQGDDHKVLHAFGYAKLHFAQGSSLGIISYDSMHAHHLCRDHIPQRNVSAPGQVCRTVNHASMIIGTGCTDADTPYRASFLVLIQDRLQV